MADTGGGKFMDDIRYGPQQSGAWHGEHETYGTEQQFMEGEKLQDLAGLPYQGEWRSTYANPITEFVAENPVTNLAVDARGILRQGGGPTSLDWAMLGLSGLPMVAPYARTAGTAIASKLRNKVADDILETQLKHKGYDPSKILETPPQDIYVPDDVIPTSSLPENVPRLAGAKPIREMTWNEWDSLSSSSVNLSPIQNAMMRAQGFKEPDEVLNYFWDKGARKELEEMLSLAKSQKKMSDEAFESMFSDELTYMRERDLHSGWLDAHPEQIADDMAWKHLGDEFDEMFRGTTEPLAVAQKMSWRPDNVSHEHWAQFTKDMTMKEVENAYRRYTLKLID